MFAYSVLTLIFLGFLLLSAAIKVLREYERAVIFRLGRVIGARDRASSSSYRSSTRWSRVPLRTVTMDVPPQDVITRTTCR